ncbi:hypothetical protein [Aeromicrobium sp. 179-A 4D2 NHS]|uniref:hypothetical protein n=1 Tax=Aeromicrobium sp. 179-A 4D2 NHS TaxID=3142375 RepID=UPI0039A14015
MTDQNIDVLPSGTTDGRYVFITATGSTYTYDADNQTLTRHPDDERVKQWLADGGVPKEVKYLGLHADDSAVLRADGDPIHVIDQGQIRVGQSARFILDLLRNGIYTHRVTSPVAAIVIPA